MPTPPQDVPEPEPHSSAPPLVADHLRVGGGRDGQAARLLVLGVCLGAGTCVLGRDLADDPLEQLVVSTLGIEIFLGFVAFAGAVISWEPITTRLGLGRSGFSSAHLILAALGTVGLSHAVDSALSLAGLREASVLAELDTVLFGARGKSLAFAILGLGVAPALGEELLCRGLLQRGLVRRYGALTGIGIGALAFGAMHLEWIQGTAAALLGLYLGAVAFRAGSVRPAIFCHCCNNLTALALGVSGASEAPGVGSAALGLATASAAAAVLFLRRPAR